MRRLRDVKYYEAIFDILAKQLELAKLDEAREGAFIQIVDPAVTAGAEVISEARDVHHCGAGWRFHFRNYARPLSRRTDENAAQSGDQRQARPTKALPVEGARSHQAQAGSLTK